MAKQIVERERVGHRDGEAAARRERRITRQRLRSGDDDFPVKRGIKSHIDPSDRKSFDENLSPLIRFLQKSVGRPWDKVHSEICEQIKLSSTVQRHILEHVQWEVETNIRMIDGKPWVFNPYSWNRDKAVDGYIPLISSYRRKDQLYVNPKTGLLCKAPRDKKTTPWRQVEREERAKSRYCPKETPLVQYHLFDGIWFEIRFRNPTADEEARKAFGHWETVPVSSYAYPEWNPHGYVRNVPPPKPQRIWRSANAAVCVEQFMTEDARSYRYYHKTEFDWYKNAFGRVMLPIGKRQLNTKEVRRVEASLGKIRRAA